jgi:hypothetical protein
LIGTRHDFFRLLGAQPQKWPVGDVRLSDEWRIYEGYAASSRSANINGRVDKYPGKQDLQCLELQ